MSVEELNKMDVEIKMAEDVKKEIVAAEVMFRPLINYGKCFAVFKLNYTDSWRRCSVQKVMCFLYFVFVQLLLWGMFAKYLLVLYREKDSGRILPVMALCTYYLAISYVSLLTYLTANKHLKLFCQHLNEYQQTFGPIRNSRRIIKRTKYGRAIAVIVCVFFSSLFCYGISGPLKEEYATLLYPLNFDTIQNSAISYTLAFLHEVYTIAELDTLWVVTDLITSMVSAEFEEITNELGMEIDAFDSNVLRNKYDFENKIENLRQKHAGITKVLEMANCLVRHYLFGIYAVVFPIICFVLYGVIRNVLTIAELFIVLLVAGLVMYLAAAYSITGAMLNFKAHRPLNTLMKIDIVSVTDKTTKSVALFVSSLTSSNIGFRVYELFTLDTRAILALTGTLVTYAVVMLQFYDAANLPTTNTNSTCG